MRQVLPAGDPGEPPAVDFYRRLGWEVMDMVLMGKEFE
jgi:hypothetical protein